jgi:hypothetical protein
MIEKNQHETDLWSQMIETKVTWNWSLITNDRKNHHKTDL